MAPKRPRSLSTTPGNQNRAHWPKEDWLELLAWLDYALMEKASRKSFEESIVVRLRKSRGKDFTLKQIDSRLKSIWTKNGHNNAKDYAEMYTKGSSCLPGLSDDEIERIQTRVHLMKDELYVAELTSPRLRSERNAASDSEYMLLGLGNEITSPTRKQHHVLRRNRAVAWDTSPSKRIHHRHLVDLARNVAKSSQASKKACGRPPVIQSSVADSEESFKGFDDSSSSETDRVNRTSSSSFADLPTIKVDCPPSFRIMSRTKQRRSRHDKLNDNPPTSTLNLETSGGAECDCDSLQAQINSQDTLLNNLKREREEDNAFFENRLFQAEKEIRRLSRRVICANSTSKLMKSANTDSLQKTIFEQKMELANLQATLSDKKFLRPFSTLAVNKRHQFDVETVQTTMGLIGRRIQGILPEEDLQDVCTSLHFSDPNDLQYLFRRSHGLKPGQEIDSSLCLVPLSDITFQSLLSSLISASLCEWVFEPDLSEISVTPCRLLEKYRLHLATQDGENALRNLDFAAYHSLIESEYFQKLVIPRKASDLASRLLHVLGPLFSQLKSLDEWKVDILGKWGKERARLTEIFECALKVKVATIVSKDLFEAVLFSPGTTYSQLAMRAENSEHEFVEFASQKSFGVKLSVLPGLCVYEHDRKLVDCNSFVQDACPEGKKAHYITRAVVILDKDDDIRN